VKEGEREREKGESVERVSCKPYLKKNFQLSQCVMTHNMANYLQIEEDSDAKGTYTNTCARIHITL
jgi:hypothetical protein